MTEHETAVLEDKRSLVSLTSQDPLVVLNYLIVGTIAEMKFYDGKRPWQFSDSRKEIIRKYLALRTRLIQEGRWPESYDKLYSDVYSNGI